MDLRVLHRMRASAPVRQLELAFSLTDLLVVCVVFLIVLAFMPSLQNRRANIPRTTCVNNLNQITLAARIYAIDHQDQLPGTILMKEDPSLQTLRAWHYFSTLKMELTDPRILICPADRPRSPARNWTAFNNRHVSYFVSLSADGKPALWLAGDRNLTTKSNGPALPAGLFSATTNSQLQWTAELHQRAGNIAMGDGSVQQLSNSRLTQSLRAQPLATNLLLIP